MDFQDFQNCVTHFSLQLDVLSSEKEVKVGGVVKEISLNPFSDEQNNLFHSVLIEDPLGLIHVYVSEEMYQHFLPIMKVGETVFFEGFINILGRFIGSTASKEAFVYAYSAEGKKEVVSL